IRDYKVTGVQTCALPISEIVLNATKEYQTENDVLADFIYESCIEGEEFEEKSSELYVAYSLWFNTQRMPEKEKLSMAAFGRRMRSEERRVGKECRCGMLR